MKQPRINPNKMMLTAFIVPLFLGGLPFLSDTVEAAPFSLSTELDSNVHTITGVEENATPTGITINPEISVHIALEGRQGGYFEVSLPKDMISGITDIIPDEGTDIIDFEVISETEDATIIAFELPEDTTGVDIIAERVVPEFPSGLILAVSVSVTLGLVFAISKHRNFSR